MSIGHHPHSSFPLANASEPLDSATASSYDRLLPLASPSWHSRGRPLPLLLGSRCLSAPFVFDLFSHPDVSSGIRVTVSGNKPSMLLRSCTSILFILFFAQGSFWEWGLGSTCQFADKIWGHSSTISFCAIVYALHKYACWY